MWPEPAIEPLPRKEFNKHLDALLITSQLNPDVLVYCDRNQQRTLNEVKKSLTRIKNKYARKATEDSIGAESSKEPT